MFRTSRSLPMLERRLSRFADYKNPVHLFRFKGRLNKCSSFTTEILPSLTGPSFEGILIRRSKKIRTHPSEVTVARNGRHDALKFDSCSLKTQISRGGPVSQWQYIRSL